MACTVKCLSQCHDTLIIMTLRESFKAIIAAQGSSRLPVHELNALYKKKGFTHDHGEELLGSRGHWCVSLAFLFAVNFYTNFRTEVRHALKNIARRGFHKGKYTRRMREEEKKKTPFGVVQQRKYLY